MITKLLMKASEHIGGRFHPAFKKIIQAEVKSRNLGDTTEFLKLAMLNLARSPESLAIIKSELVDTTTEALLSALGVNLSFAGNFAGELKDSPGLNSPEKLAADVAHQAADKAEKPISYRRRKAKPAPGE